MSERNEDLYETRTNLLSCDNMVDYFWRKSDHNSYPFKPNQSVDIVTKEVDSDRLLGKEIFDQYEMDEKDKKNSMLKGSNEYNFDICEFETLSLDKIVVSRGYVALVYKPDRKWYSLFLIENPFVDGKSLRLLMRVKQKVSLFGSFENEMITFY